MKQEIRDVFLTTPAALHRFQCRLLAECRAGGALRAEDRGGAKCGGPAVCLTKINWKGGRKSPGKWGRGAGDGDGDERATYNSTWAVVWGLCGEWSLTNHLDGAILMPCVCFHQLMLYGLHMFSNRQIPDLEAIADLSLTNSLI
jgi:hypothetical protein